MTSGDPRLARTAGKGRAVVPLPQADLERRTGYAIAEGVSIEAEGVCRFDERKIECWDPAGRPHRILAHRIDALLSHPKYPTEANLALGYGRKNRIVVLRHMYPMTPAGEPPRYSLRIGRIGDGRPGTYSSRLLGSPMLQPGIDRVRKYELAYFVQEEPTSKRLHLRLIAQETMPTLGHIALHEGASCEYAGCRFTLQAIERLSEGQRLGFASAHPVTYRLSFLRTGEPNRRTNFWIGSLDETYCDSSGALVTREEYQTTRRVPQWANTLGGSPSYFRASISGYQENPSAHVTEVLCNFDPAEMDQVDIRGFFPLNIDVSDIPLDPR